MEVYGFKTTPVASRGPFESTSDSKRSRHFKASDFEGQIVSQRPKNWRVENILN